MNRIIDFSGRRGIYHEKHEMGLYVIPATKGRRESPANVKTFSNCEFFREFRDFGGRKWINHERHEKHETGMGVV